jgi:hypothetical protein
VFAYALGLFACGAVLTGAHNQRLFPILATGSLGLGVLWEVFEWVYDQFARPNVILGKKDTILDLVADARGPSRRAASARGCWGSRRADERVSRTFGTASRSPFPAGTSSPRSARVKAS